MGCLGSKRTQTDLDLDDESYEPLLVESNQHISTPTSRDHSKRNDNKSDRNLEMLLIKLEQSLNWRNIYVDLKDKPSINELRAKLHELLNSATVEIGYLIQKKRFSEAEDLVDAILRVKNSLGDDLFDATETPAFVREVTTFDNFVLTGGQYFEPTMVNEEDDNLVKLFFFIISDPKTRQAMFRYYVEYTSLIDEYFALRLVTSTEHLTAEMYGSSCPSYWDLRLDVIRNTQQRLNEF